MIASVGAEGASVKLGCAVTVSAMVVDALGSHGRPQVIWPPGRALPLIVTVTGPPVAAVLLAVKVNWQPTTEMMPGGTVMTDGVVQEFAVTPVGKPDAVRVTGPGSPPASIAEIVLVPLPP